MVSLPRGISRHVVRFVRIGGTVYAIKEIFQDLAEHEYAVLRELVKQGVPVVQAVGVVANRITPDGEPLDAALVTKHLRFSLPYRALFSRRLDPDLETKLLDALAELIVRLHLAGFAWGDCSLSNTLFRRDAGALAAYLVDAETGEMRDVLSRGQRQNDLEIAETNLAGELLDLQMSGLLPEHVDPLDTALSVVTRYERLWAELTQPQTMGADEWWRIEQRLRRLNELGYDAAQIQVTEQDGNDPHVLVQTQVVEAGHHRRRLQELTGLSVQENQARRILNDLDSFRSRAVLPENDIDEDTVARYWMEDVFEPVHRGDPPRPRQETRTGRDLPRGAGTPLVPVRGRRTRGLLRDRGAVLRGEHSPVPAGRAGDARSQSDGDRLAGRGGRRHRLISQGHRDGRSAAGAGHRRRLRISNICRSLAEPVEPSLRAGPSGAERISSPPSGERRPGRRARGERIDRSGANRRGPGARDRCRLEEH